MAVVKGYKLKDACLVVHDVTQQLWGYRVTMETPQGEERFIVSGDALAAAHGQILLTTKGIMKLSTLKSVPDYSGRKQMLYDLFARRFTAPKETVIPFDAVAKLCALRYGVPYHVYRGMPLDEARAVIAPRGSGIVGVDFKPSRGLDSFLFKCKGKPDLVRLEKPYVLAFSGDAKDEGYSLQGVVNGCLTFYDMESEMPIMPEIEYLISHSV